MAAADRRPAVQALEAMLQHAFPPRQSGVVAAMETLFGPASASGAGGRTPLADLRTVVGGGVVRW